MKYDVYSRPTGVHVGILTDKGIPYANNSEAFKNLISQIARGVTSEDKIVIVARAYIKDQWGRSTNFLDGHWKRRAKLADLQGYRIKKTPKQIEEITRIVTRLSERRGFSITKIVNETQLTKPQIRHILGFDWTQA